MERNDATKTRHIAWHGMAKRVNFRILFALHSYYIHEIALMRSAKKCMQSTGKLDCDENHIYLIFDIRTMHELTAAFIIDQIAWHNQWKAFFCHLHYYYHQGFCRKKTE